MGEPGKEGEGEELQLAAGGGATGGFTQRLPERDAVTDRRLEVPPRQRALNAFWVRKGTEKLPGGVGVGR